MEIELNGKSLIDSGFVSGGLEGNAGTTIMAALVCFRVNCDINWFIISYF